MTTCLPGRPRSSFSSRHRRAPARHAQLSQDEIVARTRAANYDAEAISDPDEALARLSDMLRPDDVVLLLTSGELGGLIRTIPQLVEAKYPL